MIVKRQVHVVQNSTWYFLICDGRYLTHTHVITCVHAWTNVQSVKKVWNILFYLWYTSVLFKILIWNNKDQYLLIFILFQNLDKVAKSFTKIGKKFCTFYMHLNLYQLKVHSFYIHSNNTYCRNIPNFTLPLPHIPEAVFIRFMFWSSLVIPLRFYHYISIVHVYIWLHYRSI